MDKFRIINEPKFLTIYILVLNKSKSNFFYFHYPSNIFQHTRKMFMVCQCSLKWFCEQKKHFPSIAMLFILNQIFNTEFSILDARFEKWGISLKVYLWISPNVSLRIFCYVMGLDHLQTSKYICWIINWYLLIMSNLW